MEDLKTLLAYFKEHKKASLLSLLQLSWGPHWGWQLFIIAGLAENGRRKNLRNSIGKTQEKEKQL